MTATEQKMQEKQPTIQISLEKTHELSNRNLKITTTDAKSVLRVKASLQVIKGLNGKFLESKL